jgi:hypothetical protein
MCVYCSLFDSYEVKQRCELDGTPASTCLEHLHYVLLRLLSRSLAPHTCRCLAACVVCQLCCLVKASCWCSRDVVVFLMKLWWCWWCRGSVCQMMIKLHLSCCIKAIIHMNLHILRVWVIAIHLIIKYEIMRGLLSYLIPVPFKLRNSPVPCLCNANQYLICGVDR